MIENIEWMTVSEATKYLKCSKPTLYKYISLYNITTAKLLGKYLVSKKSLNDVLLSLN